MMYARTNNIIGMNRVYQVGLLSVAVTSLVAAAMTANYTIDTYAGNGTAGYSGDGGAAAIAMLDTPYGIAVASNGDVYFADSRNLAVRKVDYGTGVISTVAGTAEPSIGDGLAATVAGLDTPSAVAVDSSSNVFIADTQHQRIRKLTNATGLMSTIGGTGTKGYSGDGGPATDAKISGPDGIAVDSSGNVIFTDTDNNRIRKITAGGTISTIAGTGAKGYSGDGGAATAAKVQNPEGISIDGSDNIFFADTSNNVIRKFTDGGNISTVAGTGGKGGYSGDGGAATSAELDTPTAVWVNGSDVYVADTGNDVVRKFVDGGNISTVAGTGKGGYSGDGGAATSAKLDTPMGVAMDSGNELYIADNGNQRIRVVDSGTGNISTYGGTGTGGYSGDGGAATSADIDGPLRLFVDGSDDLFLADSVNHVIRKIALATGNISLVAGTPGQTDVVDDGWPAADAYIGAATGVAIDSSGNLFIACTDLGTVRRVDGATSIITTVMGTGSAYTPAIPTDDVLLDSPAGIDVDDDDNVYVVDRSKNNNRVVKHKISDTTYSIVAGTGAEGYTGDGGSATWATLSKPEGVGVDRDGNVYIADTNNHVVRKVDIGTGLITTIAGVGVQGYSGDGGDAWFATMNKPARIRVDRRGAIYIVSAGNHVVRRVDTDGIIDTIAGTGVKGYFGDGGDALFAEFDTPAGIGFERFGRSYLYISDTKNNRVRWIDMRINSLRLISWEEVDPR